MAKTPNVASAKALNPARTPDNPDITIVRASALWSGERRLEGESYLTEGYRIRGQIEAKLNTRRLDAVAAVRQPSRLKGTQVGRDNGVPFLTATQVFDIQPRPRKWLAKGRTPDFEGRFVAPEVILLTRSGSVGDAIVSYSPLQNAIISDDLLRVKTHQQSNFGYLYAFLRARFGRAMLQSTRYGSIIKHLEPEQVVDIPVPVVSDEMCESMNEHTRNVFKLRDEAFLLVREAEEVFESHIGAPTETRDWWFSVPSDSITRGRRRLDGYHHNTKVKEIVELLVRRGIEVMPLSSVCERVFGVARFKHVYQETGIPYIDSEDLFKINPELIKFIPASTMPYAERYYVDSGWLLMASSGQLYGLNGSVVLAGEFHERKIISNHVVRIVPGDIRSGYLTMILGHERLGKPLVQRFAFGSQVPEIAPEDLADVPVVRLAPSVEDEIADRIEKASALRSKANDTENEMVSRLEADLTDKLDAAPHRNQHGPAS